VQPGPIVLRRTRDCASDTPVLPGSHCAIITYQCSLTLGDNACGARFVRAPGHIGESREGMPRCRVSGTFAVHKPVRTCWHVPCWASKGRDMASLDLTLPTSSCNVLHKGPQRLVVVDGWQDLTSVARVRLHARKKRRDTRTHAVSLQTCPGHRQSRHSKWSPTEPCPRGSDWQRVSKFQGTVCVVASTPAHPILVFRCCFSPGHLLVNFKKRRMTCCR
jgi:hypothetical protein